MESFVYAKMMCLTCKKPLFLGNVELCNTAYLELINVHKLAAHDLLDIREVQGEPYDTD